MRVKTIPALFFIMLFAFIVKGQDTIHMRSGDVVMAKVTNVGTTKIKYTKWDNPDGPKYSVLQSDVAFITYHNGSKDVFKKTVADTTRQTQLANTAAAAALYSLLNYNTNTNYTLVDSTINFMAKVRLMAEGTGGWGYGSRLDASYNDLHLGFLLSAYTGFGGVYGLDATLCFFKSDKIAPTDISFTYQGEYHTHTYATVTPKIEKINSLGLHIGYSERKLATATLGWLEYASEGEQSFFKSLDGGSTLPLYNEVAIGPQYVWAIAYKAVLNDGSHMQSSRRVLLRTGLDLLYYPTTPVLNAHYDSLAAGTNAYYGTGTNAYYGGTVPSNLFSSTGIRLYFKWELSFTRSNFDMGLVFEGAVESNLAGFGWMEGTGLYFGL
jgi:hypothetical protein